MPLLDTISLYLTKCYHNRYADFEKIDMLFFSLLPANVVNIITTPKN